MEALVKLWKMPRSDLSDKAVVDTTRMFMEKEQCQFLFQHWCDIVGCDVEEVKAEEMEPVTRTVSAISLPSIME